MAYIHDTYTALDASRLGVEPEQADSGSRLSTALVEAVGAGLPLTIKKPGTYNIASAIYCGVAGDVTIDMAPGVVLVADAGLEDKLLHLDRPYTDANKVRIKGWKIDVSAIPVDVGSTYGEIYIGEGFTDVAINGIEFYHGVDYRTAGGDSSLFIVARKLAIRGCTFIGAPDASIYLSGRSTETLGEEAIITGNHFYGSNVGLITKRKFRRGLTSGNVFSYCNFGIATGEADTSLLPGLDNIITSNHFYRTVAKAIDVRWSDATVVTNNRIEDMGLDLDGVATASSVGISLSGSSYCTVTANTLTQRDGPSTSGHRGINLESKVIDGNTQHSTYNVVEANITNGFHTGIIEEDSNQNFNSIRDNLAPNCTVEVTRNGVSSTQMSRGQIWLVEESTAGNAQIRAAGAASSVGIAYYAKGTAAHRFVGGGSINAPYAEISAAAASPVNYLQLLGHSSGNSPILRAVGAGTDLDVALEPKGAGHVRSPILSLTDGVTAPSTVAGRAVIYVDTADGDLKVKFGDGTVKTIVTDT